MKACQHCRHFIPISPENPGPWPRCNHKNARKYVETDYITGEVKFTQRSCVIMRDWPHWLARIVGDCGRRGRFFEDSALGE